VFYKTYSFSPYSSFLDSHTPHTHAAVAAHTPVRGVSVTTSQPPLGLLSLAWRREGCPPLPHHLVCVEKFTSPYLTLTPPTRARSKQGGAQRLTLAVLPTVPRMVPRSGRLLTAAGLVLLFVTQVAFRRSSTAGHLTALQPGVAAGAGGSGRRRSAEASPSAAAAAAPAAARGEVGVAKRARCEGPAPFPELQLNGAARELWGCGRGSSSQGTAMLTFGSGSMSDFLLNWVEHVRRLGDAAGPYLVGALDGPVADLCKDRSIASAVAPPADGGGGGGGGGVGEHTAQLRETSGYYRYRPGSSRCGSSQRLFVSQEGMVWWQAPSSRWASSGHVQDTPMTRPRHVPQAPSSRWASSSSSSSAPCSEKATCAVVSEHPPPISEPTLPLTRRLRRHGLRRRRGLAAPALATRPLLVRPLRPRGERRRRARGAGPRPGHVQDMPGPCPQAPSSKRRRCSRWRTSCCRSTRCAVTVTVQSMERGSGCPRPVLAVVQYLRVCDKHTHPP